MKALWFDSYGDASVLRVAERAPPLPLAGEVQLRVHAASINPLDWKLRAGQMRMMVRDGPPRGLGSDFSGVISAIGEGVTNWRIGEAAFGSLDPWRRQGAFSEFVTVACQAVTRKPANVSFEEAATLGVAAATAYQALIDHAHLAAGQTLLLLGASGGVGSFTLQLARHLGAVVTAVASGANAAYVTGLGARRVIDYTTEDFRGIGERFDVVFDAAGVSDFASCRRLLNARGLYLTTVPGALTFVRAAFGRLRPQQRVIPVMLRRTVDTLDDLAALAARGILRPTITQVLELAQLPAFYAATPAGHARGKSVVRLI